MTATEGLLRRHGPLDTLDARRELMIAHLADWREVLDPCAGGHTEHGPEAHVGRRLVKALAAHPFRATGFPIEWPHSEAVEFIERARFIEPSIDERPIPRPRNGFVSVLGADDRLMFFEVRP